MGVQVYSATHDGQGNPLSAIDKQFISFKYGGRDIEEFGLIASFPRDRLEKNIYANFSDITSNNEGIDGQIHWGTYFNPGYLSFVLVTDGMTSLQYEDFKNYFRPGEAKELILSEHPNRGIMARLAEAPNISLLPFKSTTTFFMEEREQKVKTSLYKGEIYLNFVMDKPYWYAKSYNLSWDEDLLGVNFYLSFSRLSSNDKKNIDENFKLFYEDILKTILEDGIPIKKMFLNNQEESNFSSHCFLANNFYFDYNTKQILGNSGQDIMISKETPLYLYNCGTAGIRPEIFFDIPLKFDTGRFKFIRFGNGENYFDFSIGNNTINFTLPGILASYNKAISLVQEKNKNTLSNEDLLELQNNFRDKIFNHTIRQIAIQVLESTSKTENFIENFNNAIMQCFGENPFLTLDLNNETGESQITIAIKNNNNDKEIVENAGDMIMSKYLKIDNRTKYNEQGEILPENCLKISSTCDLSNIKIIYQYTYL